MAARHVFVLAGSLWETARFFIVISLLARLFRSAGVGVQWAVPWLLVGGSGNLLMAAGGFMLSLFPDRHKDLIGFLRLGKVLSLFSFVLLLLSGAARLSIAAEVVRLGAVSLTTGAVLFAIFVLDLLSLAALIAWRAEKGSPSFAALPD